MAAETEAEAEAEEEAEAEGEEEEEEEEEEEDCSCDCSRRSLASLRSQRTFNFRHRSHAIERDAITDA